MAGPFKEAAVAITTATTTTVIAAQTNKIIRVYGLFLANQLAQDLTFLSDSTPLAGAISMSDFSSMTLARDEKPWFTCGIGEALKLTTSAASKLSGRIYYTVEA